MAEFKGKGSSGQAVTFEDADSQITDRLSGRVIDYVVRNGLELEIHFQNSNEVVILQSTIEHHIVYKRTDVRIALLGVSGNGAVGNF